MNKKIDFHTSKGISVVSLIITVIVIIMLASIVIFDGSGTPQYNPYTPQYQEESVDTKRFNILSSAENKDLEEIIMNYVGTKGYDVNIEYAGTLDIMNKINKGEKYDAIWISNSIWSYMIDSKVATVKNAKSTSITPVIFGIKKSKAQELGFIGKTIYTKDLVNAISAGNLKFTMASPTTTNSGASAYLGLLYTLAGNPEVLTEEILNREDVRENLRTFFSGLERSSGSEDFLEQSFLNGDYEAVVSYESSIIKINQELEQRGRETLYAIYPVDGVSICDNPFSYIDNKNENKKQIFLDIQSYLLSDEGQRLLQKQGRRTWFGGINENVDKNIFNPNWGIDTTKYISPVKYPSTAVIKEALLAYQTSLRKPIHVVFCLDYSGSMYGNGIKELRNAMQYILTEEAAADYIQFSQEDKIEIVPFSDSVKGTWTTNEGTNTSELLKNINQFETRGSTALYPAAARGIELLQNEDTSKYNVSVILMTDGEGNVGTISDFEQVYKAAGREIPVYSIMFGYANNTQLESLAELTNGKVFDGKENLVAAFKEVRGYN
ncbi:MAG: VWA domain-containing protein [Clostridia bacterium]|nr:VWA domain-containing protein [Clostridia bacterium]